MKTFELIGNFFYIFGPILGFIPQIITRKITFSPFISLLIVISNGIRLIHWTKSYFDASIAIQSFVTFLLHMFLLFHHKSDLSEAEILLYKPIMPIRGTYKRGLFVLNFQFILSFLTGAIVMTVFVGQNNSQIVLSSLNFLIELSISGFQFYIMKMDGKKVDRSMRFLHFSWFIGDLAKIAWISTVETPIAFILVLIFQMIMNGLLIINR